MSSLQDRIAAWARKQLEIVPSATLFNLRVVDSSTGATDIVEKFKPPKAIPNPEEVSRELAADIMLRAKDVAKSMSHIAKFQITACITKQRGVAEKRSAFPFTLRGEAMDGITMQNGVPAIGETEPPTPAGLTAQLMRHLEAQTRLSIEKDNALFEGILRENQRLQARANQLETAWEQAREAREELLDASLDRKLRHAKAEAEEMRKNQLMLVAKEQFFPQLAKFMPAVIDKILPGAVGAASQAAQTVGPGATDDVAALKKELGEVFSALPEQKQNELLDTVGPEKAEKLLKILGVL